MDGIHGKVTRLILLLMGSVTTLSAQERPQPVITPVEPVAGTYAVQPGIGGDLEPLARRLAPGTSAHAPVAVVLRARAFEETGFAQFMASRTGRLLRVGVGAAMIGGGLAMGDTGGAVLAVAGVLPLSAGALDLCYLSPLFGGPLRGEAIRRAGGDSGGG